MGIYACPRCGNPNGWWSGNMRDIHDCPGPPRRQWPGQPPELDWAELDEQPTDGVKASGEALQRHRGEAPTADGMFPGESVAEAARSWQGWCEHRSMTGLALFLGKVAKLADGVVVDRALNTTPVADQKAANLIDNADGVSASGPHPLPAQANDGGEHA